MRLVSRYRQLIPFERRMFFSAVLLVPLIRIGLWVLPFRLMQSWVNRIGNLENASARLDRHTSRQVAWSVEAASRRIPRATCLTQGLATQILLGRLGQRAELRLGVARRENGQLEAHAWVETQGRIITGDAVEGFNRYVPLKK